MSRRPRSLAPDLSGAKVLGINLAAIPAAAGMGAVTPPGQTKVRKARPLPAASILGPSDARLSGPTVVTLPGFHPTRLNELIHAHPMKAGRMKYADAARIGRALREAGIPGAAGPRRMGLVIVLGPRQRGGDPDAYDKSARDAMVRCGALVDDNRQWLEPLPTAYERAAEKATRIILEDLP